MYRMNPWNIVSHKYWIKQSEVLFREMVSVLIQPISILEKI